MYSPSTGTTPPTDDASREAELLRRKQRQLQKQQEFKEKLKLKQQQQQQHQSTNEQSGRHASNNPSNQPTGSQQPAVAGSYHEEHGPLPDVEGMLLYFVQY